MFPFPGSISVYSIYTDEGREGFKMFYELEPGTSL
jgi:hypothetical protein